METGLVQSYCTHWARLSPSNARRITYEPFLRSRELAGVKPSFKVLILFSLSIVRLEGTATLARFRSLSVAAARAKALERFNPARTAVPPTPARKLLRFRERRRDSRCFMPKLPINLRLLVLVSLSICRQDNVYFYGFSRLHGKTQGEGHRLQARSLAVAGNYSFSAFPR